MLLGAGGGSLLGLLTAPDRADGTAQVLAPAQPAAPTTLGDGTTTSSSGPSTTTSTT